MCRRELGDIEAISIVGYEGEYLEGLAQVAARRREGEHLLVLFLGSTIGNFERAAAVEFLREIRRILRRGDSLLLGTDLEKPVPRLLAAYDDPLGITAAFNLNLLARINRELDGNFNLDTFEHHAFFNRERNRVEMHLASLKRQKVKVNGETIDFRAGETIHTENSYKYSIEKLGALARGAGWRPLAAWTDPRSYFSIQAFELTDEPPVRAAG